LAGFDNRPYQYATRFTGNTGEVSKAVAITSKRLNLIVLGAGSSEPRVKWELFGFAVAGSSFDVRQAFGKASCASGERKIILDFRSVMRSLLTRQREAFSSAYRPAGAKCQEIVGARAGIAQIKPYETLIHLTIS